MKKVFLFFSISIFIFSCKKDGANNPSSATGSYLSSVKSYSAGQEIEDSFVYNDKHNVAEFLQLEYDGAGNVTDSAVFVFSFGSDTTKPISYTFSQDGNPSDSHQLFYDGQNRISKDTSLSGSGFVTYYTYPNNNIASTILWDGTPGPSNNQIDTLFSTNGNITAEHQYYPNDEGTADSLEGNITYRFSSYANPAYYTALAKTIGPLLHILQVEVYGTTFDPISKNLFNSVSEFGFTENATISTDTRGRVSKLTDISGDKIVFSYY